MRAVLQQRLHLARSALRLQPLHAFAVPSPSIRPLRTVAAMAVERASNERLDAVLSYWFGDYHGAKADYYPGKSFFNKWFFGGVEVDKECAERFLADYEAIARGEYDEYRSGPNVYDTLGVVIVIDQFARNLFRGSARSFALDAKGVDWARELVTSGRYKQLPLVMQGFLILPFEHTESMDAQNEGLALAAELSAQAPALEAAGGGDLAGLLKAFAQYAKMHADVIERWGRFPHRNAVLGRPDTPEEAAGLADGTIKRFG